MYFVRMKVVKCMFSRKYNCQGRLHRASKQQYFITAQGTVT